jgi:hypothetical protein
LKRAAPDRRAPDQRAQDQRAKAKRAALNALRRARRAADKAGVELSEWEGEFLGSVSERVQSYGRAFGDPEKGAPGAALSMRQGVKLKEIAAKAQGTARGKAAGRGMKAPRGLKRRTPLGKSADPD